MYSMCAHTDVYLDAPSGLGIRVEDAPLYRFVTLDYGLREGADEDDGQGKTTITMDMSNSFKFPGMYNVCGSVLTNHAAVSHTFWHKSHTGPQMSD